MSSLSLLEDWAYYLRYAGETLKILKKVSDGQEGERRKKVKLVNRWESRGIQIESRWLWIGWIAVLP